MGWAVLGAISSAVWGARAEPRAVGSTAGVKRRPVSGRGSGAATVGGVERQEDDRLALEGGTAVGESFAALQVRGDVLDANGLQAGGG